MNDEIFLLFFDRWEFMLAILCVVILLVACVRVEYLNTIIKDEKKTRRKMENSVTRTSLEREAEFLLNKGTFVKNVSNALEQEYQKDILRKIERMKSIYQSGDYQDFCKTFLIDYKEICYNELSNDRVLSFSIVGYYNLDALDVNPAALALALCKYSYKWQNASLEYREGLLGYYEVGCFEANKEYWNEYIQEQLDNHCAWWGPRLLK